jgi:D-threo-aldose 1-dehydrogenase
MPAGHYTLLDQSALDDVLPATRDLGKAHGTILPAAAIASPYTHPSIINVTLGMRTPEQVGRNVELHDRRVPDACWDDLRTQGLIRSNVPGARWGRDARCH